MRKNNTVLLDAEEQLVFGTAFGDMRRARDALRHALPGCLLLELLEAKIARTKAADWPRGVNPCSRSTISCSSTKVAKSIGGHKTLNFFTTAAYLRFSIKRNVLLSGGF